MGGPVEDVDKEEDEMLLVVEANAVVDPRTVVVHPCNAVLADGAVM